MEKVSLSSFSGNSIASEEYVSLEDVKKAFEAVYRKYFPKSAFEIGFKSFMGVPRLTIYSGLFQYDKDLADQSVTVRKSNNPAALSFTIREADKAPRIKDKEEILTRKDLTLEINNPGFGFYVKPPEGSNLVMKWYKIPYRKAKGDIAKLIMAYDKAMNKFSEELRKNKDKLYLSNQEAYGKLLKKYLGA